MNRTIHYCWFGRGEMPKLAKKCINSWKKYCPDYEIIEWNEDNFDVFSVQYIKQAYEAGKYAFVSDYARFWVLYNFGGLYFDTDDYEMYRMHHAGRTVREKIRVRTYLDSLDTFLEVKNKNNHGRTKKKRITPRQI